MTVHNSLLIRPIPLKVVPEWRSGADGTARLQLLVAPHPGLKGGLQNVSLVVSAAGATGLFTPLQLQTHLV